MKPIRTAIIGFGKIAEDQHVPAIAGNPRFELAASKQSPRNWLSLLLLSLGKTVNGGEAVARAATSTGRCMA